MANEETTQDMSQTETGTMIGASKATGTRVFDRAGNDLGTLHDLMIDKRSGRISYAVIAFGGFLGLGSDYYPLPWNGLKYDTRLGGYVSSIDTGALEGAPRYAPDSDPQWNDAYDRRMRDFYGEDRFIALRPELF